MHSCPTTVRKYLAIPEDEIPDSMATARERQHQLAMQKKQQEVDEARKLAQTGYPIEQISVMMHHTCKTIQNYLNPGYSVTDGHYNARIPGKLAPFEKDVIELRSRGLTYPQIHKILCEKGYTGRNGRRDKRASGIGLYLCRQICGRLGIGITIHSKVDAGTEVRLDLGSSYKIVRSEKEM